MPVRLTPAQRSVGAIVTLPDGQRFEAIGTRPGLRHDGQATIRLTWRSACTECGEPFEFSAPMDVERWTPRRRCDVHKAPGVPVRPRRCETAI